VLGGDLQPVLRLSMGQFPLWSLCTFVHTSLAATCEVPDSASPLQTSTLCEYESTSNDTSRDAESGASCVSCSSSLFCAHITQNELLFFIFVCGVLGLTLI